MNSSVLPKTDTIVWQSNAANAQVRNLGMPGFEVVAVAHPIQPLDSPDVRTRADLAFPEIINQLVQDRVRIEHICPTLKISRTTL